MFKNTIKKIITLSLVGAILTIGPAAEVFAKQYKPVTAQIVKEVKAGKYGNGNVRKKNLEKLGYSYAEVQAAVNGKAVAQPAKKAVAKKQIVKKPTTKPAVKTGLPVVNYASFPNRTWYNPNKKVHNSFTFNGITTKIYDANVDLNDYTTVVKEGKERKTALVPVTKPGRHIPYMDYSLQGRIDFLAQNPEYEKDVTWEEKVIQEEKPEKTKVDYKSIVQYTQALIDQHYAVNKFETFDRWDNKVSVIYGHNGGGVFGHIDGKVKIGDEIIMTTIGGTEYRYKCVSRELFEYGLVGAVAVDRKENNITYGYTLGKRLDNEEAVILLTCSDEYNNMFNAYKFVPVE